jgi:hypothetical protein
MARYNGMGWHFQSIRHSNARKYGRAGGKYASRIAKDGTKFKIMETGLNWTLFVKEKNSPKWERIQSMADAKTLEQVMNNQKEFQMKKNFGYAQTNFKTFQLPNGYEIIAHWEKTRNGFRHIAILMKDGSEVDRAKATYQNRTWESYEYQSVINTLLNKTKILSEPEQKAFLQKGEMQAKKEADEMFGNIGAIAKLGEIMTGSQKEANTWKARMIKAGLGSGIQMPEDWNTLTEDEKESRLNKVIEYMKPKKNYGKTKETIKLYYAPNLVPKHFLSIKKEDGEFIGDFGIHSKKQAKEFIKDFKKYKTLNNVEEHTNWQISGQNLIYKTKVND